MLTTPLPGLRALLLALSLAAAPNVLFAPVLATVAMAQDDDDGDDDDDDDDDDDRGGGNSRLLSVGGGNDDDDDDDDEVRIRRPAPPRAIPQPLPDQAMDQIVVQYTGANQRERLISQGFSILSEEADRLLLKVPSGMDVAAALVLARADAPDIVAAPNSYYRSQAVPMDCIGAICGPWQAVGWPPASADPLCAFEPHIGVIDTGVNVNHDMLLNAAVTVQSIASAATEPSEHKHGTAIVALFVGDPASRVPGLVPKAQVLVVDPFGRVGADERSDVFTLATALDLVAEAGVDIASLSLAGPPNEILRAAIEGVQGKGIPIVAAVGNAGPRAEPLYPAAYPDVIAVTAVDSAERVYRRAVQGEQVAFAGPGVEIATAASISGVRPQTGTSFAVPFVTTALAAAMADGTAPQAAIERLAAESRDLGDPGKDNIFGWGLVQIPDPCSGAEPSTQP